MPIISIFFATYFVTVLSMTRLVFVHVDNIIMLYIDSSCLTCSWFAAHEQENGKIMTITGLEIGMQL